MYFLPLIICKSVVNIINKQPQCIVSLSWRLVESLLGIYCPGIFFIFPHAKINEKTHICKIKKKITRIKRENYREVMLKI